MYWVDELYVEYREDAILEFWGDKSQISNFISKYPKNKHILAMEEHYYLSAGLTNRYGSFTNYQRSAIQTILSLEPTSFYTAANQKQLIGGEASMWAEFLTQHNFNIVL